MWEGRMMARYTYDVTLKGTFEGSDTDEDTFLSRVGDFQEELFNKHGITFTSEYELVTENVDDEPCSCGDPLPAYTVVKGTFTVDKTVWARDGRSAVATVQDLFNDAIEDADWWTTYSWAELWLSATK